MAGYAFFFLLLLFLVVMGCMSFYTARGLKGPPRERRKHQRWVVVLFIISAAMMAYSGLSARPFNKGQLFSASGFVVGALLTLYGLTKPPEEREQKANYRDNPGLCGRCDYNLTGNTSGVCPECGWQLPIEPLLASGHGIVDSPGWAFWWDKWEIESLANWKHTFVRVSVIASVFLAMAILMAFKQKIWLPACVIVLIDSFFILNVVRVAQYGWRHRKSA